MPDEGQWELSLDEITTDECGLSDSMDTEDTDILVLTLTDDVTFDLSISGGQTVLWTCTLDEGDFACEDDVELFRRMMMPRVV